jgi:hypothetical protein
MSPRFDAITLLFAIGEAGLFGIFRHCRSLDLNAKPNVRKGST